MSIGVTFPNRLGGGGNGRKVLKQGCNFWKMIGGAERRKYAQDTIKILMGTDFTSDLAHFLHHIGGAQLCIGGAEALPKR